jgi:hypothetical protein
MRDGRIGPFDLTGEHIDPRQIALVAAPDIIEPLGIFDVGEELSRAELDRPLQRHAVFTFCRPLALQIRVAPRRACVPGRFADCLRKRLYRQRERQRGRQRPDGPTCHVVAPDGESTPERGPRRRGGTILLDF